jgi:hypothetical protein
MEVLEQTKKEWLPSFWQLVLKRKLSLACLVRYYKLTLALKKARKSL